MLLVFSFGRINEYVIEEKIDLNSIPVSMDLIVEMDDFGKLTENKQLRVLNNFKNFIGLSKSAKSN